MEYTFVPDVGFDADPTRHPAVDELKLANTSTLLIVLPLCGSALTWAMIFFLSLVSIVIYTRLKKC